MQQRGRKSAAALSVVVGSIDGRPKPLAELTKGLAEIWERVVASEAADMFKTAALQEILADYCRHRATIKGLDSAVEEAMAEDSESTLEDIDRLLKIRERETRASAALATKLRLTNQSRYQPSVAAVAARNVGTEKKLWQRRA